MNGGTKQGRYVNTATTNTIFVYTEPIPDAPTVEVSKEIQQTTNSGQVYEKDTAVLNMLEGQGHANNVDRVRESSFTPSYGRGNSLTNNLASWKNTKQATKENVTDQDGFTMATPYKHSQTLSNGNFAGHVTSPNRYALLDTDCFSCSHSSLSFGSFNQQTLNLGFENQVPRDINFEIR